MSLIQLHLYELFSGFRENSRLARNLLFRRFVTRNFTNRHTTGETAMLGTILLIILILLLLGAVPTWPHSRNWGYGPSGGVGLLVIIVIVLLVMKVI